MPDATTLLGFRHLLERHGITKRLLEEVGAMLAERGVLLRAATMVAATMIAAPSSTKNASHRPDPEMYQTKKGNGWHFGRKAHLGCDMDQRGGARSRAVTAANIAAVGSAHRHGCAGRKKASSVTRATRARTNAWQGRGRKRRWQIALEARPARGG